MSRETIAEQARHNFSNCRAAFRLLQGILLSGHSHVLEKKLYTDEELELLEEKFVLLEQAIKGDNSGVYNKNDAGFNDIQLFFLTVNRHNTNPGKEIRQMQEELAKLLHEGGKKLLLIDDQIFEAGWNIIFELLLGKANIYFATNYVDASEIIQKFENNIFSIFIDLSIPDLDNKEAKNAGFNIIELIAVKYPFIPLIAFSAYDNVNILKKAFQKGAWDYFSKEPVGDEVIDDRKAEDYYAEILKILYKHLKFAKEYHELYLYMSEVLLKLESRIEQSFYLSIRKNLLKAFQYLTLKDALRFTPGFLSTNTFEEVVFQSTKALDSFISSILNIKNLYPPITIKGINKIGNLKIKQVTLGEKISYLRSLKELHKESAWFAVLEDTNILRNMNAHQEELAGEVVWNPPNSFVINNLSFRTQEIKEENAKKMVHNVLTIIDQSSHLLIS